MKKLISILVIIIIGVFSYVLIKKYYFDPDIYPLKSKFYTWAGDTRIVTPDSASISVKQLEQLRASIKPGDIFLNRSDYYLSNIGIPGFWTHSGFYIGDSNERNNFFSNDSICSEWVKSMGEESGNLEKLLNSQFQEKYLIHIGNEPCRPIIESLSEGVVLSFFTDAAAKDGIVALRPKVTKLEVTKAIYHAFELLDRPYDFNFDFSTDTLIACTELIYRIYEDSKLFAIDELFGKPFCTANEIAMHYDSNFDAGNLKLEMIFLFDGEDVYTAKSKKGQQIFRESWQESLW